MLLRRLLDTHAETRTTDRDRRTANTQDDKNKQVPNHPNQRQPQREIAVRRPEPFSQVHKTAHAGACHAIPIHAVRMPSRLRGARRFRVAAAAAPARRGSLPPRGGAPAATARQTIVHAGHGEHGEGWRSRDE